MRRRRWPGPARAAALAMLGAIVITLGSVASASAPTTSQATAPHQVPKIAATPASAHGTTVSADAAHGSAVGVKAVSNGSQRTLRPARVGQAPEVPTDSKKLSPLPSGDRIHTDVILNSRDPAALATYAAAVGDPTSALYRHYLSRGAFAARFGADPSAVATVAAGLRAEGLTPGKVSANGLSIPVNSTAGKFSRAFSTGFAQYRLHGGRVAYANTAAPQLSGASAPLVQTVLGLDDLVQAQATPIKDSVRAKASVTHAIARPQVVTGGPQPCSAASSESPGYTADQLASAYGFSSLYGQGDQGQGQTVALIEFAPYISSDIEAYQSCYGTNASISNVTVDGGGGIYPSAEDALDIEDVIGLAPQANIGVYEGSNSYAGIYDDYAAAITDDTAKIISTSWGFCEGVLGPIGYDDNSTFFSSENTLFEEAAVQGQSVVASAGDTGSEGCGLGSTTSPDALGTSDPSSQPFVTGVGGTTLPSIDAPQSETVWNSYYAGGGGLSRVWDMPGYQSDAPSSVGVIGPDSSSEPCGAPSGDCREVPDASADADPYTGYVIYFDGAWATYGGTSASAPLWAVFLALSNSSSACGGQDIGFANPALYGVAASEPGAFNDITIGNNDFTRTNDGLYPAGRGYDMASGLGTPTANLSGALCTYGSGSTLSFTSASSAAVAVSSPASVTVTTSGSPAPSLAETGAVPTGMVFHDNGDGTATISGTPTETGSFVLSLVATAGVTSATQSFTLTVGTAPSFTTANRTTFTVGTNGLFELAADGSPQPSISLTTGTLPAGVYLNSRGDLFGTPAAGTSGTYPLTVETFNGISPAAIQSFTLVVDGVPSFTSAGTAGFVLGTASTFTATTTGEPPPTVSETGLVPPGLTFAADEGLGTASLSGTPTQTGTFTITLSASNSYTVTPVTQQLVVTVVASAQSPVFTSADHVTFQSGTGPPFTFGVTATGAPPPTFSIASGSLPQQAGVVNVTLSSSGVLSALGLTFVQGVYRFVIEASNGLSAPAYQDFTLTIDSPGGWFPSGNGWHVDQNAESVPFSAIVALGQPADLTLTSEGFPIPTLTETGPLPPGLTLTNYGNSNAALTGTPTEAGTFVFEITGWNGVGWPGGRYMTVTVAAPVAPRFLTPDHTIIAACGGQSYVTASGDPVPSISERGGFSAGGAILSTDFNTGNTDWPGSVIIGSGIAQYCATPGTYTLTMVATSSAGTATQTLTLTILASVPTTGARITSPSSVTLTAGIYNAALITNAYADGAPCAGSAGLATGPLPTGLHLGQNGLLWGVPTPGRYEVLIDYCGTQTLVVSVVGQAFTSPTSEAMALDVPTASDPSNAFTVTTASYPDTPAMTEIGSLPAGVTFTDNGNGTATFSGDPTEAGVYPITLVATRVEGQATQAFTLTIAPAQAPAITAPAAATFIAGAAAEVDLSTSGVPTPNLTLVAGSLPTSLTLGDDGVVSGILGLYSLGTYPLTFEASNGVDPPATQDLVITVDGPAAWTQPLNLSSSWAWMQPHSLVLSAYGYPAPALTVAPWTPLPPGVAFVDNGNGTATISGTPTQVGSFAMSLEASNAISSISTTYIIDVGCTVPPYISSATSATATVGTPFSLPVTTCSTSMAATGLPAGLKLVNDGPGTGTIVGTPAPSATGVKTVTIENLVPGQLPTKSRVTITTDAPPIFTSKASDIVHAGALFSFRIGTEHGYPAPAITASGLPSWATLVDHGTGVATLSGTPPATAQGDVPLTITATNGVGAPVTQSFTLIVYQAPTITSVAADIITTGVAMTPFHVITTGFPSPTVGSIGLPSGLKVVAGYLEGKTTAAAGTYVVTIGASSKAGNARQSFTLTILP